VREGGVGGGGGVDMAMKAPMKGAQQRNKNAQTENKGIKDKMLRKWRGL
jgi:hypothetical protein